MASLRNHCYNLSATVLSICIVVDLHAIVSNMKVLSFTTEMQRLFPFAGLSKYEMIPAAVNNTIWCNVPGFNKIWSFSPKVFVESLPRPVRNFTEFRPFGAALIHGGVRMDVHEDVAKLTSDFHDLCERAYKQVEYATLNDSSQTLSWNYSNPPRKAVFWPLQDRQRMMT